MHHVPYAAEHERVFWLPGGGRYWLIMRSKYRDRQAIEATEQDKGCRSIAKVLEDSSKFNINGINCCRALGPYKGKDMKYIMYFYTPLK